MDEQVKLAHMNLLLKSQNAVLIRENRELLDQLQLLNGKGALVEVAYRQLQEKNGELARGLLFFREAAECGRSAEVVEFVKRAYEHFFRDSLKEREEAVSNGISAARKHLRQLGRGLAARVDRRARENCRKHNVFCGLGEDAEQLPDTPRRTRSLFCARNRFSVPELQRGVSSPLNSSMHELSTEKKSFDFANLFKT